MDLKPISTEELIKELQRRGMLRIFWHLDDVKECLEEHNYDYTPDELIQIGTYLEDKFDASVGLSWDIMGEYIYNYLILKE